MEDKLTFLEVEAPRPACAAARSNHRPVFFRRVSATSSRTPPGSKYRRLSVSIGTKRYIALDMSNCLE